MAAGHEVTGGTRTGEGVERLRAQGASAVRVDVFDADSVHGAVADAAPDTVIHQLTALANGDRAENGRIRREGTRHLVDAAKRAGVRRIVAQSISWAYAPGDAPAGESTPLDLEAEPPRAGMVGSLRALEKAAAEIGTHVMLRYGTFCGPGTWYARGGPLEAALRGERAAGDPVAALIGPPVAGAAVSSFVHVEDAAWAAVAALDWPSGTVNIVDDEPAPANEWLPYLASCAGAKKPMRIPTWVARLVAGNVVVIMMTEGRGFSNAKAKHDLGWELRYPSWRQGFKEGLD